ncbi:retropepsin-like aspartic protease [Aquimarina sp. W85]|uniref:retropepsin-like aspartic protease n=1 Tax=Aquimarina rhodophyticola TaxID=3342246 RepID=UPI0036705337
MKLHYLIFFTSITFHIAAQQKLPVLRANSPILNIKEGDILTTEIWRADQNVMWDEFVTNSFEGVLHLSFISDIDTLSLKLQSNKTYDFIVLLPENEKAYTRISTDTNKEPSIPPKKIISYKYLDNRSIQTSDTLSFTIGPDNRIYLKGKINQSDTLNFIFDTGANAMVITKDLIGDKVKMQVNGTTQNIGFDGSKTVSTSSNNTIEIGNLKWDSVPFISVDYKNKLFDAVLGWNAFERKIIELDYDKKFLIIHNQLKNIPLGYQKIETKMIGGLPYIYCTLTDNDKISKGWIEFDTGYNYSILLSQFFDINNTLENSLIKTGDGTASGSIGIRKKTNEYLLPELKIGNLATYQIPISISTIDTENTINNDYLGNALLKRFNAILDFKNYLIYLKPNTLLHTTYYKRIKEKNVRSTHN